MQGALARHVEVTISELRDSAGGGAWVAPAPARGRDGDARWVGGVVTSLARKYTKRGDLMATFVLEDLESAIEVWVFPRTMVEVAHLLVDDAVVCIKGRLDTRDDQPKLVCMEVKRPSLDSRDDQPLHVDLPVHALTDERVESLKRLLSEHPGPSPVLLHVGAKCVRLASQFRVDTTRGLLAELRVLLGPACLPTSP
ncbi:MAG: OB-fold nucleic acid binding domain-containing protein, partial [Acidimicrobiales bacterium]